MLPLLAGLITADPGIALILADSGDEAMLLTFPYLAGPVVFAAVDLRICRYYRSPDTRHHFEQETEVAVGTLRRIDRKRATNNRQRSRPMSGANQADRLEGVRRLMVE